MISAIDQHVEAILALARENNVEAFVIGRTKGERLVIQANGERIIDRAVSEIESAWRGVLPRMLEIPSLVAAEEL